MLALYRRYRPETFAEVIGQEHVTDPLAQAIRNDRVNHAYLFSGPRGCGKTTSARILARALNCENGPTPTPCGTCGSCVDLARGGGGGLDVVEIDAASHGGVDDARDLRDRAAFAPASARFKIFIIDEAHMVTPAGFNALLKVVEEPPPHLKFIFATTEPDKVIATIRSRTHHYPFRLVPPGILREYLATLCEREGVQVAPAVLPLVVRAGAGSVRDSLSVLDQLIAGADGGRVTLARATALLGYTDAALLDDVIEAFAAHDGAAVFGLVDRVIEGGHDPRRFVADLLDRLRDLIVIAAVPDAGSTGLIDAPVDAVERMTAQASRFGSAEISRAADLVNTGLTEMRGATAPRLQLELICARVLLPGAGTEGGFAGERDLRTRLERLERRLAGGAALPALEPAATLPGAVTAVARPAVAATSPAVEPERLAPVRPAPVRPAQAVEALPAPVVAKAMTEPVAAAAPAVAPPAGSPEPGSPTPAPAAAATVAADITTVRRMWPDVLDIVKARRRYTWMLLMDGVQVTSVDAGVLVLAFADEGKRRNFQTSGSDELLTAALFEVLRAKFRLDAVLDPNKAGAASAAGTSAAGTSAAGPSAAGTTAAGPAHAVFAPLDPLPVKPAAAQPSPVRVVPPAAPPPASADVAPTPAPASPAVPAVAPTDDHSADPGDVEAPDAQLSGRALLEREFGASVLSEVEHD
ncbi:MAG: DNA polymerase III subunit gamma and tau [Sporichthyaceae bacterium]